MSLDRGGRRRMVTMGLGCGAPRGIGFPPAPGWPFRDWRGVESNSFGFGGVNTALVSCCSEV
jgi:hypothetical protein